ncbi:hypothetical protein F3K44_32660 [Bacillus megaterium]|nr:hypothetical protein [Priestia megaterium]
MKYFATVENFEPKLYEHNKKMIRSKWENHIDQNDYSYSSFYSLDLNLRTFNMIQQDLIGALHKNHLLTLIISWLEVLDEHLGKLIMYEDRKPKSMFPYNTSKGKLLFKRSALLTQYAQAVTNSTLEDVNYNILRNRLKSFCLITNTQRTYNVTHKKLPPSYMKYFQDKTQDVGEMKFGFLSQNLDLREDYIWNKQAENGRTLFYFEGISKEKIHRGYGETF